MPRLLVLVSPADVELVTPAVVVLLAFSRDDVMMSELLVVLELVSLAAVDDEVKLASVDDDVSLASVDEELSSSASASKNTA